MSHPISDNIKASHLQSNRVYFSLKYISNAFTDPIRRCRNEGGHDLSYCSSVDKYEESDDSTQQYDIICGEYKPRYRVCHISALNGEGNEPHYDFTPYSFFNKQSAEETCAKIGGNLPRLEEELDSIWIQKSMEDLLSFVTVGWPFSLKWLTYPVRNTIHILVLYLQPDI